MKRIGLITSGGDAPGMNTAIRAVVRSADARGVEAFGFLDGYLGLIEGRGERITARDVGDVMHRGGTILRTARCPEMHTPEGQAAAVASLKAEGIDGLVVIGGDGSLNGARALAGHGVHVVGIPASIDNDIWGTRMSLGVDSALNTIMEAIDKLRDTASSHKRAFLIETMGRDSGYLAAMAGVICGAELVVSPDHEASIDEVSSVVADAHARGKPHCFVVVAEGARLGVDDVVAHLDQRGIGYEARVTKLGHVQRGGGPSAFDRLLASRMGVHATQALLDGENGVMVALDGSELVLVPLDDVCSRQVEPSVTFVELSRLLAR
ncbi:MAG: ATP-dependent 6-phosphofructokinase [Gemmatimonadota bacterium]